MTWLYLAIGVLCSTELFIRLPFRSLLGRLTGLSRKIKAILLSADISDHWKEKCLPHYALQLLVISLQLFGMMLLAIIPLGIILFFSQMSGYESIILATSPSGILFAAITSVIYLMLRSGFVQRFL